MTILKMSLCLGMAALGAVCFLRCYLDQRRARDLRSRWTAPGAEGELRLRNIVRDEDILRTKCTAVERIDSKVLKNLDGMLEIMYKNKGIGLAANQVGLTQRLVVVDLQENGVRKPIFLVNPEILEKSRETGLGPEGCLSVPVGEKSEVRRSVQLRVKYLNKSGEEVILEATGLLAICLQHEIDHLDGILYIDHLSEDRRNYLLEKAQKRIGLLERGKIWK
ncbi:MAG: peptide deformylase [Rickettsiales bacterium]|jgi:peptide deformylase|nr:peptide deformylase [Rickettsiales bacterium]